MRLKVNQNILKTLSLDFPTDTLIYEKDFSKQGNRKTKLLYKKMPLKVLKQYFSLVYAVDLFGRVKKLFKNNIKKAHSRTVNLFQNCPRKYKLHWAPHLLLKNGMQLKNLIPFPSI